MKIHDVFVISPCPKSQKFAHELVQDLKEERISVFGDFQRMKGQSDSYILDLLRASSNVIIVLPLNIENYLKNGDFFRKEISCILEMDKNVLLLNSENFKWPDVLPNDISKIKFATELYLTNDYTDDIPGCYIYEILSCLTNVPALESKPFTWKEKFRIASVVISLICWILPFLITCFFFNSLSMLSMLICMSVTVIFASVLFLLITIYLKEFEKNIFVIVLMVTLCFLANFLTLYF